MKKISIVAIVCIFMFNNILLVQANASSEKEMRAVWVTTVYNQDWPSQASRNNVQAQKDEFIRLLDDVKSLGFNAVMLQVRPKGDALYKSNINPWSDVLTGTQGKDPGYDPLSFAIEEAHKRGVEVHAWFNPYRVTTSGTDLSKLSEDNFARKNPGLVVEYKDSLVYNPGLPEVKQHIVDTVAEVVRNYNVDGIHFDDYFYPGNDINDTDAYNRYGNGMSKDDFRRNNVNEMVRNVYNTIKSIKSNVQFGISPRGIWKNKSSDSTGSDTNGAQSYYDIYADTRAWIKNGWLDYVVPQIYWEIGNRAADYSTLVKWWNSEVNNTNVKLYIGQGIYKPVVAREIDSQIALNRTYNNVKGSAYFSYSYIKNNLEGIRDKLLRMHSQYDAQLPDSSIKGVAYKTHVQHNGWQDWKYNGQLSGTTAECKRLESIEIKVNGLPSGTNILYRTHVENDGWLPWKQDGEISGTVGESKRVEALEIKLTGSNNYKVEYRAHVEEIGWQDWKSDGQLAGTVGEAKRIEAVEIRVVEIVNPNIIYETHIQQDGWQGNKVNGQMSGTVGQAKRLEAIKIALDNMPQDMNLVYETHVQEYGWTSWKSNGELSGTVGEGKRLEAIRINLQGNTYGYHIEYRVHMEEYGWGNWVRDGEIAGTTGKAKRVEAIEIRLVK